jgi:hypothetical protein
VKNLHEFALSVGFVLKVKAPEHSERTFAVIVLNEQPRKAVFRKLTGSKGLEEEASLVGQDLRLDNYQAWNGSG